MNTDSRELIVSGTPFIIPYTVRNGTLEIIAVLHCARQWTDDTGGEQQP